MLVGRELSSCRRVTPSGMLLRILGISSLAGLAACATSQKCESALAPTVARHADVSPASRPDLAKEQVAPASYVAIFEDLTAQIEAHHMFSPVPKALWSTEKARLRREFDAVATREQAMQALVHLQNALRDPHCQFVLPREASEDGVAIGMTLFAEDVGGTSTVRVDEILDARLGKDVQEGDEVISVDGVPVQSWFEVHPNESRMHEESVRRWQRANAIVKASVGVKTGDARTLRLRRGTKEWNQSFTFEPSKRWESSSPNIDSTPLMKDIGCRSEKYPLYEDFSLSAVGVNVCIYTPIAGRSNVRRDTRLVRFPSFDYSSNGGGQAELRMVKADHELLRRELAHAGAVVLDVHENHGGQNPYTFLHWFSKRPWDHYQTHVLVSKSFSENDVRRFLYANPKLVATYAEAAREGREEVVWPFNCWKDGSAVTSGTCERDEPRASELVTTAPIVVVSGPECGSSCDAFVSSWSTFSMGGLVGRQPTHALTMHRHAIPVTGPDGRPLGTFFLAVSWAEYPRTPGSLEGARVRLDSETPVTFDTRRTWVDRAVKAAVDRAQASAAKR